MILSLVKKHYDEIDLESRANVFIGVEWPQRFVKRHSELQTKFSSQVNKQCIVANSPQPI